VRILE